MTTTSNEHDKDILALLELALPFTGTKNKDVRLYLHDIVVTQVESDTHIVACSGHMLVRAIYKDYTSVLPERLDYKSVKQAIQCKRLDLVVESAHASLAYPDINRLIPTEYTLEHGQPAINASYLATACAAYSKAAKHIASKAYAGLQIMQSPKDNASVFLGKINNACTVEIIIMPMRL